jgi:MFS family permease
MKIDLVGPKQRGLAMGLNEFAGYLAVSFSALATGYLAATYGLRPVPFYPGFVFALLGLLLSLFFVQDTHAHVRHEAQVNTTPLNADEGPQGQLQLRKPTFAQIFLRTSWQDRTLFATSQAGLVNNLNDGVVWGLLPIFLVGAGLPLEQVSLIAALYPGVWGISQLFTGALSDHWGRKWLIATGMWVQALGIWLFVMSHEVSIWIGGATLLGLGTALVYPTLLATIADVAHPEWRASAVGVYRLWRDMGYALGALLAGLLADYMGIPVAIAAVGGLTLLSGIVVAAVMRETRWPVGHQHERRH